MSLPGVFGRVHVAAATKIVVFALAIGLAILPRPGSARSPLALAAATDQLFPAPETQQPLTFANCKAFDRYIAEKRHSKDPDIGDFAMVPTLPRTEILPGFPTHYAWIAEFHDGDEVLLPKFRVRSATLTQRRRILDLEEAVRIHEQGHAYVAQKYMNLHSARGEVLPFSEQLDHQFRLDWAVDLLKVEHEYDEITHHGGTQRRGPDFKSTDDGIRFPGGANTVWPGCK